MKFIEMVELLKDFPQHVAAYKASGQVDKEEYEQIVMAKVNEVADKFGKINFLVLLETDMQNFTLPAFLEYLKISFEHFTKWNRMAIVTDQKLVEKAYDALSYLVPGVINGFELKQFEEAKEWVSAPLEEDL
jgi:hypothetical protein